MNISNKVNELYNKSNAVKTDITNLHEEIVIELRELHSKLSIAQKETNRLYHEIEECDLEKSGHSLMYEFQAILLDRRNVKDNIAKLHSAKHKLENIYPSLKNNKDVY